MIYLMILIIYYSKYACARIYMSCSTSTRTREHFSLQTLFVCCRIHLDPHVLEWIGWNLVQVPLQSTSIYVD